MVAVRAAGHATRRRRRHNRLLKRTTSTMSTVSKYRYDEKGQCASASAVSEQRGTVYAVIGIVHTHAFWADRKEQSAHKR